MTGRGKGYGTCWLLTAALLLLALQSPRSALRAQDVKPADAKAYAEALERFDRHQYTAAAQQLRRLASRNPRSADVQYWLGLTAAKDGVNVTAMRRYFSKCLELQPDYPQPLAHYYMGVLHYTDDRFDDAVRELKRYFELAQGGNDKAVNAVYDEAANYLSWSQFLADAELNRAPFAPQRVQGVSSQHNELFPYLSVDGQTFYYLRQVPVRQAPTFYTRMQEQKQWLLYSSRWQDTAFDRGKPLPAPFNSGDPEGSVSLTADGSELYYSIIRNSGGYANSDIYCVRRVDGEWQTPEALGPQVNGDASWESQPTVSADGRTLIFASNRKGGAGGIDLWRCHRLANGDWSRAENLGTSINTPGNEKAPFLAADGHTLYFLSDGWQGFGGYDIYFANLNDEHSSRPVNLGLPINTEGDELSFGVTTDGRRAYVGYKAEGAASSDVMLFDLYPAARPDPMRTARLDVRDTAGRPLPALDVVLLPESGASTLAVAAEGMFPALLTLPAGTRQRSVQLRSAAPGTVHPLDLGDGLEQRLDKLADWLVAHPRIHLQVECPHAADAARVVDLLRARGLRAERFTQRGGTAVTQPQLRVQ